MRTEAPTLAKANSPPENGGNKSTQWRNHDALSQSVLYNQQRMCWKEQAVVFKRKKLG